MLLPLFLLFSTLLTHSVLESTFFSRFGELSALFSMRPQITVQSDDSSLQSQQYRIINLHFSSFSLWPPSYYSLPMENFVKFQSYWENVSRKSLARCWKVGYYGVQRTECSSGSVGCLMNASFGMSVRNANQRKRLRYAGMRWRELCPMYR
jgi:hypothetical protein